MGITGGGQDGTMTQDLLHLEQVDPGLDQMSGITVAQAVGGNLFFNPQPATTLRNATWTPPRSKGVEAKCAPFNPPWRLGNNHHGWR